MASLNALKVEYEKPKARRKHIKNGQIQLSFEHKKKNASGPKMSIWNSSEIYGLLGIWRGLGMSSGIV